MVNILLRIPKDNNRGSLFTDIVTKEYKDTQIQLYENGLLLINTPNSISMNNIINRALAYDILYIGSSVSGIYSGM